MLDVVTQNASAAKCFAWDAFQNPPRRHGAAGRSCFSVLLLRAQSHWSAGPASSISSASSVPLRFKGFTLGSMFFSGGSTWISADCDEGDILRSMSERHQRQQSGIAKAPALLLLLGVAIFLAGAMRFLRTGNFTLAQAGYCLLSVPVALLVLLVFDYTLHHARFVAVMVLIFVALFLVASPAFCVGLGLGLAGMVLQQARGSP
jgi:hypothetical protein